MSDSSCQTKIAGKLRRWVDPDCGCYYFLLEGSEEASMIRFLSQFKDRNIRITIDEGLVLGQPVDGWVSGLDWSSYVGEKKKKNKDV